MNVRQFISVAAFAAPLVVTGCLPIPHRHTDAAGARFHVTDQSGRPISTATVNVYAGSIIGHTLRRVATARTDAAGFATILRAREWHFFVILIPDAEAPTLFGWCVSAPDYAPLGRAMEDAGNQTIESPLLADTASAACPKDLDRYELDGGRLMPGKWTTGS